MDLGLSGKTALVVGASRGIGRSIATVLAREGASVCLVARRAELLAVAAGELGAEGRTVAAVTADVATEAGARQAVEDAIDALGSVDILVHNVGGSLGSGRFDEASPSQWAQVMDLNLMSAVWCCQAATGWMKAHGGGSVVLVSSVYGREYGPASAYMTAKAGVIALAKSMALDLARYQIRVNSVAPGSISFPGGTWARKQREEPARIARMLEEELPWHRFGRAEEVAEVVAFLASERASWVTGTCVPVDGGQGHAL